MFKKPLGGHPTSPFRTGRVNALSDLCEYLLELLELSRSI